MGLQGGDSPEMGIRMEQQHLGIVSKFTHTSSIELCDFNINE